MPTDQPRPQLAFIAAALALLVLPFLALMGLNALGLAAGLMTPADGATEGAGDLLLALFFGWVVLVLLAVLLLVRYFMRRSAVPE